LKISLHLIFIFADYDNSGIAYFSFFLVYYLGYGKEKGFGKTC